MLHTVKKTWQEYFRKIPYVYKIFLEGMQLYYTFYGNKNPMYDIIMNLPMNNYTTT
jgi:hypothetical protein